MKIAISGKGGSGKTTIAGTLVRAFALEGEKVLAIDSDTNPNLALTLGMPKESSSQIECLPRSLLEEVTDASGKKSIKLAMAPEEIVMKYGVKTPGDVTLLLMGKPDHAGTGCLCGSHRVVRTFLESMLDDDKGITITDMEAGLEHLSRGTARNVDVILAIAEPYYKSLETARRTTELAAELAIKKIFIVANKVRNEEDQNAIQDFCQQHGLDLLFSVPFDESFFQAERNGVAPMDYDENSVGVGAIKELTRKLRTLRKVEETVHEK